MTGRNFGLGLWRVLVMVVSLRGSGDDGVYVEEVEHEEEGKGAWWSEDEE